MKRCKHKRVEARIWSRHFGDWTQWQPGGSFVADAIICRDCGEWLSLGPSNDEPEAVKVEMRAAEIVASHRDVGVQWPTKAPYEWSAWLAFVNTPTDAYGLGGDESGFAAGWLARAIATHSEPQ